MTNTGTVPSPRATGGAGATFEQHVGAWFLALLLLRGVPVIFRRCLVTEVSFQTRHLGWQTDDILVTCDVGEQERCQLPVQVKLKLTISASNDECVQTFRGFWRDFKAAERFNSCLDALVLVVQRGTDAIMDGLGGLLDCARNSRDGADFVHRLDTAGFVSKKVQANSRAIKAILAGLEESPPTDDEFWRFLKVIYLLPLDLCTATARDEASAKGALAWFADGSDVVDIAGSTWSELVVIAGAAGPGAGTFRYENLPDDLRTKHHPLELPRTNLRRLQEHSSTTLAGIKSTIGEDVEVPRLRLQTHAVAAFSQSQMLVLRGLPGTGKSALARALVESQASDYVCISFRAEEFAKSHIDDVLSPMTGGEFQALLGAQERVVIHVESAERLIEGQVGEAFSDLVGIAQRCPNVKVLLTCREHAVGPVLASFVVPHGLQYEILDVTPFDLEEVDWVALKVPALAPLVGHEGLKRLLRLPYYLDLATKIDWDEEQQDLPSNESQFRDRCWREIIRREKVAARNLPNRREQALVDLALERARTLRPRVPMNDGHGEALDELRKDGIVVAHEDGLFAPAHDVMEDWAISRWLDLSCAAHEWKSSPIAEAVGEHPGLRRAFRIWLTDALEGGSSQAKQFVDIYHDPELPPTFRDDVLISVLLSPSVSDFVHSNRSILLTNDGQLLLRLIHLVRIACTRTPGWLEDVPGLPSALLEPAGEAWPAVLEAIADNLDALLPDHIEPIIDLLEQWSHGAGMRSRLPDGAVATGTIAYRLLEHLRDYPKKDSRQKVLKAIARMPQADGERFIELVERASANVGKKDLVSSDVVAVLVDGSYGGPACRAFPQHMASLILSAYCLSDADAGRELDRYWAQSEVDPAFGLRRRFHASSLASAHRGSVLQLLRSDSAVGVRLVLDLVNHAGRWFGEGQLVGNHLERAHQITISVPGHGDVQQWSNDRLWLAYRGTSVAPDILQCALMALEYWLLERCEDAADVEPWLLRLLLESNNVMTTAVVASVCNAYPERGGAAALSLLTSRSAVDMDRRRKLKESTAEALLLMPRIEPMAEFYVEERKRSNALDHRADDIEALALKLQSVGRSEIVWAIIDGHRARIPASAERTDDDRVWLLALHRMDARSQGSGTAAPTPREDTAGEQTDRQPAGSASTARGIDPDLQKFVDAKAAFRQKVNAAIALLDWGKKQWESSSVGDANDSWKAALAYARQAKEVPHGAPEFINGGPGFVAAVCVRDHWDDMAVDDRRWCIDRLVTEVKQGSDSLMDSDVPAARVLPKILAHDPENLDILAAVARAITHERPEVTLSAAVGVGVHLGTQNRETILRCAGAFAMLANLLEEYEQRSPIGERQALYGPPDYGIELVDQVRQAFLEGTIDSETQLASLDFRSWHGRGVARHILCVLEPLPDLALSESFSRRVAQVVSDSWGNEEEDWSHQRDHEFEHEMLPKLARWVLGLPSTKALDCCQPILSAVDHHPEEVGTFIAYLVLREQDEPHEHETCFWDIWRAFAESILGAPWSPGLESDYPTGADLVRRMLFGRSGVRSVPTWAHLDGHEDEVDAFVKRLPATRPILSAYIEYLYGVGAGALPNAFTVVAERLVEGDATELLKHENTVFHLEALLQRYISGDPMVLRENPTLRAATIVILEKLVESGSSAAHLMRDRFAAPGSIVN